MSRRVPGIADLMAIDVRETIQVHVREVEVKGDPLFA